MINLSSPLSAMSAFATGVQGSAYNIANISTDNFQPVAVHYQSGRPAGQTEQGVRPVVTRPEPVPANALAQPSHTDLARETVNLIINQRGFEANAAVVRTTDAMLGVLIDLRV